MYNWRKMLPLFVVLFVASLANAGQDVQKALWILKCAKYATANGVPAADLPSYSPYEIESVVERVGGFGLIHWGVRIENITIHGIPDWETNIAELSIDRDPVARFRFEIYWPKLDVEATYHSNATEGFITQHYHGNADFALKEINLTGDIAIEKPDSDAPIAKFTSLDLNVQVERVTSHLHGLGPLGDYIAASLALELKVLFDTQALKKTIEHRVLNYLNHKWAMEPERTQTVIDFCKNHGI